jgi:hypothetical protein
MKYILPLATLSTLVLSFTSNNQDKYLPVRLYFSENSAEFNDGITLAFIFSFSKKQVRVTSNEEMAEMIKKESIKTEKRYTQLGGDLNDYQKLQTFASINGNKVGTSVYIVIKFDHNGFVNDTVTWNSTKLPIDKVNYKKSPLNLMILDSLRSNSLLEITDQVVEKIIASGELAQE